MFFETFILFIFIIVSIIFIFAIYFLLDKNISNMGFIFSKGTGRKWNYYQLGHEKPYGVNKKRTKGEQICLESIEKITGEKFFTVRPSWLINPETKRNLEIDIYNDKLGIGVEFQGYQHYTFPNKYHKTKEEFNKQIERDKYKLNKCNELGIFLIRIYDDINYDKIEEEIYKQIPKELVSKNYKR